MNFNDDLAGKPVGIYQPIGCRAIFVSGNSDGEYRMVQWSALGEGARFGLIVHHTDAQREWSLERGAWAYVRGIGLKF